jgi:transcriptional regulator with GAF, ATPase, and Fis domain
VSARASVPWHLTQILAGELVSFATVDEVPEPQDRDSLRRLGTRSGVTVPLVRNGSTWGAVSFAATREPRVWTPDVVNRLRVVAQLLANVLAHRQADTELRRALTESNSARDRLRDENHYLAHELKALAGFSTIVGHSPAIRHVLALIRQVAPTDSPVLLLGEAGTGKSLLAARIHELSARRERPMVRVNCAALSGAASDAELFGSERGVYAESEARHVGRLELADHSTVFFDEVADLPLDAQAMLTRALQTRQIQPLGSARRVRVDVRIIAATRRDLSEGIGSGRFRDDLYYTLNVFPIHVPPLRERPEDIPLLVWRFVDELSDTYGTPIDAIDEESMTALLRYSWPGNAREVRNAVERAIIVATGRKLRIPLPGVVSGASGPAEALAVVEREHIATVLASCGGHVHGKRGAAARLGLTPRALQAKMAALGLTRPRLPASRSDGRRPRQAARDAF